MGTEYWGYCSILYCIVLYHSTLYYTILYSAILFLKPPQWGFHGLQRFAATKHQLNQASRVGVLPRVRRQRSRLVRPKADLLNGSNNSNINIDITTDFAIIIDIQEYSYQYQELQIP